MLSLHFLFTLLVFFITIVTLVVIHEFGHYFAAKKFGIKVLEFGFGIPPRAWGKKIGETIWSLNWLPFGGFVRLLGEDEVDKKVLEDKRSFASQNVWKRITVVVAGVAMNLILAWILFYIVIIGQGWKVIYPTLEPVAMVAEVEAGYPAAEAGVMPGERIIAIDGKSIKTSDDVISEIKSKSTGELVVELGDLEGQNKRTITLTPKISDEGTPRIGVVFNPIPLKEYKTPVEKTFSGITYSWEVLRVNILGLGRVFGDLSQGNVSQASKSVAGPIGLVSITGSIIEQGSEAILFYIWFVANISLSLAFFNVLPIPALDGGRLFFLLWEAVTRRKANAEVERIIHTVGMVCLLGLLALITFSDISKFF
jgi:regulator of sigma E protease